MSDAAQGPFETFEDAYGYIAQFTNYERMTDFKYARKAFDLDRVRDVLHKLGDPQEEYPIVHVAGTKGKGSVCAMVAAILRRTGYRVGLFSKPHLIRLNERISLDGQEISDARFVEVMNRLHPHLERQRRRGSPLTFFDLITVMALATFAEEGAEFVVLEVGLGGRLDSTNVVRPAVSVITGVDLDHTHLLGETLEEIAFEKAGIIKEGVPAISGVERGAPAEVIEGVARQRGAPLFVYGGDFKLEEGDEGTFAVETWRGRLPDLRIPLLGSHQRRNAAVAVATLAALSRAQEAAVREGLREVRLPARVEVLGDRPTVVLDGAHNLCSLRALRETLLQHFPGRRWVLLLGMSRDKSIRDNLREILPIACAAVFTGTGSPRGADPEALCSEARALFPRLSVETEPDIEAALARALRLARAEGSLCIAGSFYLAGEVASRWKRGEPQR